MKDDLNKLARQIQKDFRRMDAHLTEMGRRFEALNESAQTWAESTQTSAGSARESAASARDAAASATESAASAREAARDARSAAAAAEKVAESARRSAGAAEKVAENTEKVAESAKRSAGAAEKAAEDTEATGRRMTVVAQEVAAHFHWTQGRMRLMNERFDAFLSRIGEDQAAILVALEYRPRLDEVLADLEDVKLLRVELEDLKARLTRLEQKPPAA